MDSVSQGSVQSDAVQLRGAFKDMRFESSTQPETSRSERSENFVALRLPLNFLELRRHSSPLLRTWGVARELEESEGKGGEARRSTRRGAEFPEVSEIF